MRASCALFAMFLSAIILLDGADYAATWERLSTDGVNVTGEVVLARSAVPSTSDDNDTRFRYRTPEGVFFGRVSADVFSAPEGTQVEVRYLPDRVATALPVDALHEADRIAASARRSTRWYALVGLYISALVAAWMHNEIRRGRLIERQERLPLHPNFARRALVGGFSTFGLTALGMLVFSGVLPRPIWDDFVFVGGGVLAFSVLGGLASAVQHDVDPGYRLNGFAVFMLLSTLVRLLAECGKQ